VFRENLGSIRLKVSLMEEYVLPSTFYQPLMDLIVEPATGFQTKGIDAIGIMEDMATLDHASVARQMVKIFIGQNCLLTFLDWITNKEIQRTSKRFLECHRRLSGIIVNRGGYYTAWHSQTRSPLFVANCKVFLFFQRALQRCSEETPWRQKELNSS
jgi:hypothetical protein